MKNTPPLSPVRPTLPLAGQKGAGMGEKLARPHQRDDDSSNAGHSDQRRKRLKSSHKKGDQDHQRAVQDYSGPFLKSVTLDYSAIQQDFFLSGNQRKVFFLLVSSITEVGYFSSSAQITDGFAHRVGWLVRWLADPAQMAASRFATVTRLPSYAA